jgi:hypothetical protein
MLRNRKCSFRDGLLVVGITVAILLWPPLLGSDDPLGSVGPARAPLPYVEWYRATFGVGIGAAGLFVADLGADGDLETVATAFAGQSYWYVLADEGPGLAHEWVSLAYPSGIDSLQVSDVDGDAAPEILVGTAGVIEVFDGESRELERKLQTVATHTFGLSAADLDSDGSVEFVFSDEKDLFVVAIDRGRDAGCPAPPAQIRACRTSALGSCLRC